jgi:hypothetical protein
MIYAPLVTNLPAEGERRQVRASVGKSAVNPRCEHLPGLRLLGLVLDDEIIWALIKLIGSRG